MLQAVYLKRRGVNEDFTVSPLELLDPSNTLNPPHVVDDQDYLLTTGIEDTDDSENRDEFTHSFCSSNF